MEKKGDLLNQLALISDLIEKINMASDSSTIVFTLSEEEFIKTHEYIKKKYGKSLDKPDETFSIKLGEVEIIFNKNSV